jgi:hypothetical protein
MLDTHKIAQRLMAAGMTAAEADAIVDTTRDLSDAPTRADLHKEFHTQTWRMLIVAGLILGGIYFMFNALQNDIRELRNQVTHLAERIK